MLVPETVARELQHINAPAPVRAWITQPPIWCEICADSPADPTFAVLDAGERAALALALARGADRVLLDDFEGRAAARRRQLAFTGTLGVLIDAHWAGLLDFEEKLALLRQTNFYLSDEAVAAARRRLASAKGHP